MIALAELPVETSCHMATPSAGLRIIPVTSDNMEPELRVGRHMVLVRAGCWEGEGIYTLAHDALYQCDHAGGGMISIYSLNPAYRWREHVSRTEFDAMVTGKVVATIKVHDADAQDQLWASVRAARRLEAA